MSKADELVAAGNLVDAEKIHKELEAIQNTEFRRKLKAGKSTVAS
jgi:hypothetical protein